MRKRDFLMNSIEKVKAVVNLASRYEEDIDGSIDSYVIDLKSILGLLSLSLSRPVTVTIHTDDEQRANEFFKEVEEICK